MEQSSVAAQDGQHVHVRINPVQFSSNGPLAEPGCELLADLPNLRRILPGYDTGIADLHLFYSYSPSSLERSAAASIAVITVPRRPASSSTCKPVIVVPPGEVTLPFRTAAGSPLSRASFAEPYTV